MKRHSTVDLKEYASCLQNDEFTTEVTTLSLHLERLLEHIK